jgi:6,7-dimethyl-8-ribityllumazine synthase (EC 2.5.1.9)
LQAQVAVKHGLPQIAITSSHGIYRYLHVLDRKRNIWYTKALLLLFKRKEITGDVGLIMKNIRIAFIKAGWHKEIVHNALVGFEQELKAQNVEAELKVLEVPGAFEMPLLAKRLAETGKYDAIVAAGAGGGWRYLSSRFRCCSRG